MSLFLFFSERRIERQLSYLRHLRLPRRTPQVSREAGRRDLPASESRTAGSAGCGNLLGLLYWPGPEHARIPRLIGHEAPVRVLSRAALDPQPPTPLALGDR